MEILTQKDIDFFNTNGYCIARNVFSPQEVTQLRKAIDSLKYSEEEKGNVQWLRDNKARFFEGDILGKEGVANLVFDSRILSIAKQILGSRLVYFGESNFQIGVSSRGFHRDNCDRQDPKAPDWREDYPLIKMGIYLQDHQKYSGGLKVRAGSHLTSDFIDPDSAEINNEKVGKGKNVDIANKPGDVIFWSMREAHSANFVRCRFFPKLSLDPKWENRLEKRLPFLLEPKHKERMTVWITWGAPGPMLDRYIDYYIKRGDYVNHWQKSKYNAEVQKLADANNVEIRKPILEYGSKFA